MASDGDGVSSWLDGLAIRIEHDLAPPETANVVGDATGGSFSLSPSEANDLYAQLRGIADQLRSLHRDAEGLKQVKPPADEPVSNNFNRALIGEDGVSGVFGYAIGHIAREIAYVEGFKRQLGESLVSTESIDEENKRDFYRHHDGGDRGDGGMLT